MEKTIGLPHVILADTGFASGPAVAELQKRGIEPLVAIGQASFTFGGKAVTPFADCLGSNAQRVGHR